VFKVIVIRGPLGVGKTTICQLLTNKLGAQYISLDAIIEENQLSIDGGIPLENFLLANSIICNQLDAEKTNIVDGCFYFQEQIDDLRARCADCTFFSLLGDVHICINRDRKRDKVYGEDAARFVHSKVTAIQEGILVDTEKLSAKEAVEFIVTHLI
jgi:cytidylate kinase